MAVYDAFISYSHAADGRIAPALQRGLQRFAKAWYQLRALRLFRDETTLALTPGLWPSIEGALGESKSFILMASPEAARSVWVQREVSYWLENRGASTLYIVLTEGTIVWDDARGDFDWERTDALPEVLRRAYDHEPLYLDFRWARRGEDLTLHNPIYRNSVADLAAALHGRPKDELIGEDVRQHRRTRRVTWAAVTALVLLTVASVVAASIARAQRNTALSLALGASAVAQLSEDPELSVLLAREAMRWKRTPRAEAALRVALLASKVRARYGSISWPEVGGFSPDGELGLILTGHVLVVDVAAGEVVAELEIEGEALHRASFSPDGRRIVATTEETVHVWEAGSGRHLHALEGHAMPIGSLAFSRDGTLLATASPDGIRVWRLPTGEAASFVPTQPSEGRGEAVLAPTRGWVAVPVGRVHRDNVVRIHDAETGDRVAELTGHRSLVKAVVFSPDEGLVATASWDGTVRLWETATWSLLAELLGHQGTIDDAAISPDGRWLVTAGSDRTGRVWDLESQGLAYELRGHADRVEQVAFSADGGVAILSSRDNTVSVWETGGWRRVAILRGHTRPIENVAVSPTGRRVMSASRDQTARLWEVRPDESPLRLPGFAGPGRGSATPEVFSPDGAWVVTGGRTIHDRVRVWSAATGRRVRELDATTFHGFSPDGRLAVTGGGRGKPLHLWETGSWRPVAELAPLEFSVEDISFSPDGRRLAAAHGYDDVARIWDTGTGRLLATLEGHDWRVLRVAFTPDGRFLVTASYDRTARVWATEDWRLVAELRGHQKELSGLDVSPDGRFVATSSFDGTARVWDTATWEEIAVLRGHDDRVVEVRFSPDGKRLATASWDDTGRLWSTGSWEAIATLGGHEGSVAVRFGPGGRLVATAGGRTLRLWDAEDGSELVALPVVPLGPGPAGSERALEDVRFSPDGRLVLAASSGGNVYLYAREVYAPIEELLELAEARVTRDMTPEESSDYLP